MAVGVKCPYCGEIGYTSSPRANCICPYCGKEHDFPEEEEFGINGRFTILTPGKKRDKNEKPGP